MWEGAPTRRLIRRIPRRKDNPDRPALRSAGACRPGIVATMRLQYLANERVGQSVALVGEDAVLKCFEARWYAPTVASRPPSRTPSSLAVSDPPLFNRALDAVRQIKLVRVLLYLRTAHESFGCRFGLLRLHDRYCRLVALSESIYAFDVTGMVDQLPPAIPAEDFVRMGHDTMPLPYYCRSRLTPAHVRCRRCGIRGSFRSPPRHSLGENKPSFSFC